MPRVPTTNGPSVAEAGLPDARQSSIASPELLGGAARQMQAAGDAATNLGAQIAQAQAEERKRFDALRVDDALNQAQEAAIKLRAAPGSGFQDQTGVAALSRASGMPLADEYTTKLKEQVEKIGGTLTPQQRAMFGAKANNVLTTFYGQALEHERTQRNGYELSVREATVGSAKSALALNPGDEKNVEFQTTRIRGAFMGATDENGNVIRGSTQIQGKSASEARQKADEAVSDAHGNAIKSLLEQGNVNQALAYFGKYGGQMVAKDVLEVQGKLQKDYDTRLGAAVADRVWQGVAPKIAPTDYGRLSALVMEQESGGRRYGTDGKLLTSPKGAQGEMQVMPTTSKDPGFGVRPAKDDSPEELARVGRDYLGAMVVRYRGDVPKALAAYNAGPGAVDRALAEADKDAQSGAFRGGAVPADYWLSKLPGETQNYVRGISAKFSGGAGTPAKPTIAELHEQARATLGPNASPLAIKNAEDELTRRFEDQEKATKQRGEETVARAMQALSQNGGRFSALPASIRADLTTHAPEKLDDVMNFGARIAKGDDSTDPALFVKLSDPNYLRTLSDAQMYALRSRLSNSDFESFTKERQRLLNPKTAGGPGDVDSGALKEIVNTRLQQLGIASHGFKAGSDDEQRHGLILKTVRDSVLAAQQASGKKMQDAELEQQVDRLFQQSTSLRTTVAGFTVGSVERQPLLTMKPSDIPGDVKNRLKADFKAQGVSSPSDYQLLDAYLRLKLKR